MRTTSLPIVCSIAVFSAMHIRATAQTSSPTWYVPVLKGRISSVAKFGVKAPVLTYAVPKSSLKDLKGTDLLLKDPRQKFSNPHEMVTLVTSLGLAHNRSMKLLTITTQPKYFTKPKDATSPQIRVRQAIWLMPEKGDAKFQPYLLAETPPYYLPDSAESMIAQGPLTLDEPIIEDTIIGWKYNGQLYSMLFPHWQK